MNIKDIQKFKRAKFHNRTILRVILLTTVFVLILLPGCREKPDENLDELVIDPNLYHVVKFEVFHPYDGFEIKPRDTLKIKWQTNKEIGWVNIFLYRKGLRKLSIAVREKNSNEYAWNIPYNLPWSLHYYVKIENHYNDEEFSFSDRFSITARSVSPGEK